MADDPEILYQQLAAGDPGDISAAAEAMRAVLQKFPSAAEDVRGGTNATAGWRGEASAAFARRSHQTTTSIAAAEQRFTTARDTVVTVANSYSTVRSSADQIIGFWRLISTLTGGSSMPALKDQVVAQLTQLRDGYNLVLAEQARVLAALVPAFEKVAGSTSSWKSTQERARGAMPKIGTDPREVAAWWKSLSPEEQRRLLDESFQQLGQLRGLPAEVLDIANRRRIADDAIRFRAEFIDLDARIRTRAYQLGIDPSDEDALRQTDPTLSDLLDRRADAARRWDNAESANARLRDPRVKERDDAYVLYYSPDGPGAQQGSLAVAFGNPDTADNLAVLVPGTTTDLDNGFPADSAIDLQKQMNASNPGTSNATIAWLNYDAPDAILGTDVTQADQAIEGGRNLVADVDGYRAAAAAAGNPNAHLTVIGHSYGSTTVGHAGMNGLAADDIAFIGSPGVGASSVDQLSSGAGHVWSGATEHDPVVQATGGSHFTANGLSTGPYDRSFGANGFATSSDGHIGGAHSDYYEGQSLRNLANISTGNYGDVTAQNPLDSPVGPELPGSNIPYVGPVVDAAGNVIKEGIDQTTDVVAGAERATGQVLDGDFAGAGSTLVDTAAEAGSDTLDAVVGTVGDAGELLRDQIETPIQGGRAAYENTIGRLPGL